MLVLGSFVLQGYSLDFDTAVLGAASNSVMLAAVVALLVLASATFLGFVGFFLGGNDFRRITAVASIGYAFPGTILAIGVLTVGGVIDSSINYLTQGFTVVDYRGWFTSGVILIIFACIIRFQAIGYGAVTSGLERLPPNLMDANRMLGYGIGHGMRRVILPFVSLPIVAGGLLVFVDVMKELPMTLLLRPFNFETLPTYVYQFAKDELLEEAALPALIIVATGIFPVIVMNAVIGRLTQKA